MKVFLDANIIFAASLPRSRTGRFLRQLQKHATVVTSPYALDEVFRNLERKRPDALPSFQTITTTILSVVGEVDIPDVELDHKDRPILAAAVFSNCTHLVTGDLADFGHLLGKEIGGVKVLSMQLLLEELSANGIILGDL